MIKIAFATDDLVTISAHFGRAQKYSVYTIENNQVIAREEREKTSHHHTHHDEGHDAEQKDHNNEPLHRSMAQTISDCQVMVVRGMGSPAYQSMEQAGIRPIVTNISSIEEALKAYIEGHLEHNVNRIHLH